MLLSFGETGCSFLHHSTNPESSRLEFRGAESVNAKLTDVVQSAEGGFRAHLLSGFIASKMAHLRQSDVEWSRHVQF